MKTPDCQQLPFPTPQDLPFNRTSLGDFELAAPTLDPRSPGVWIALRGTEVLVNEHAGGIELPRGDLPETLEGLQDDLLYFGSLTGQPCRTVKLPADFVPPEGYAFENLLSAKPRLDVAALSLGGLAAQLLHWHEQSLFCGTCGRATSYLPGEWGRNCAACGSHRYPSVHPCVIVLIARPGELLLVRKPEWVAGRYSLVAGFVEFGECLEECVRREVREEVGVEIRNLHYAGSQSWPFPSQLMAGFIAEYAGGTLAVDHSELDDARWFALDDLPRLPPRRSIARWLIDTWCLREGVRLP